MNEIDHPGIIDFDPVQLEAELESDLKIMVCERCDHEKYVLKKCEFCPILDAILCKCGHFGDSHNFGHKKDGSHFDICLSCTMWSLGLKDPFDRCHLFEPISDEIMQTIINIQCDGLAEFKEKLPIKINSIVADILFRMQGRKYKKMEGMG